MAGSDSLVTRVAGDWFALAHLALVLDANLPLLTLGLPLQGEGIKAYPVMTNVHM